MNISGYGEQCLPTNLARLLLLNDQDPRKGYLSFSRVLYKNQKRNNPCLISSISLLSPVADMSKTLLHRATEGPVSAPLYSPCLQTSTNSFKQSKGASMEFYSGVFLLTVSTDTGNLESSSPFQTCPIRFFVSNSPETFTMV